MTSGAAALQPESGQGRLDSRSQFSACQAERGGYQILLRRPFCGADNYAAEAAGLYTGAPLLMATRVGV